MHKHAGPEREMGTERCCTCGAFMHRMPSHDRLTTTFSGLNAVGKQYRRTNSLDMPPWCSACFARTTITLFSVSTLISSGLKLDTSRHTRFLKVRAYEELFVEGIWKLRNWLKPQKHLEIHPSQCVGFQSNNSLCMGRSTDCSLHKHLQRSHTRTCYNTRMVFDIHRNRVRSVHIRCSWSRNRNGCMLNTDRHTHRLNTNPFHRLHLYCSTNMANMTFFLKFVSVFCA